MTCIISVSYARNLILWPVIEPLYWPDGLEIMQSGTASPDLLGSQTMLRHDVFRDVVPLAIRVGFSRYPSQCALALGKAALVVSI